jgi:oxepin-CoA hydrolase / 3-oxo-5,6-dehydrosuberyl-CoA semialdehyde dehydrogenase
MQELTLAQANDFLENQLENLMKKLTPDSPRQWGQMTPQHVVEHLAWVASASNGSVKFDVHTPEEHLPRYRKFLFINRAMDQGTKSPILDPDKLPKLKKPDFRSAMGWFWQEWNGFEEFFDKNPKATTNNAVFGPLTEAEWRLFHFKHIVHHLAQFGVTTVEAHGLAFREKK